MRTHALNGVVKELLYVGPRNFDISLGFGYVLGKRFIVYGVETRITR